MSSSYHPQSDGQTERVNQCLEQYLRCMVCDNPKQWLRWLPLVEFWYNTNFHSSLQMAPFEALYDYAPTHLFMGPYLDSNNEKVQDLLTHRQQITEQVRENLLKAQNRMKFSADKHRQEREFEIGDRVFLKLQPFRQNSVHLRKNLKLSSKYFGPYTISKRVGSVAYQLDLPPGSKIHPVFHVSLLKKQIGKQYIPSQVLPDVDGEGLFVIYPARELDQRVTLHKGREINQICIAWGSEDWDLTTWEDTALIQKKFPIDHPWGQGSSDPGGIVTRMETEEVISDGKEVESGGEKDGNGMLGFSEVQSGSELFCLKREVQMKEEKGMREVSATNPTRPVFIGPCPGLEEEKGTCEVSAINSTGPVSIGSCPGLETNN